MFSNYFFHKEKAQKQVKETQIFTMEKKLRYICFTQTTGVGGNLEPYKCRQKKCILCLGWVEFRRMMPSIRPFRIVDVAEYPFIDRVDGHEKTEEAA
jgi:hypothetical protein